MAYSCCFSLWGNLDFLDSFKKCFIILTSDKKGRRFPTQSNPPLTQLANPFFVFKIAKKFQIKNLREKGVGATKLLILDLQQCDQIRRFLELIDNKFYYKCSPNVWWLFGQLWKPSHFKSNCWGYFLGNFRGKIGLFFISTSGHTAGDIRMRQDNACVFNSRYCDAILLNTRIFIVMEQRILFL